MSRFFDAMQRSQDQHGSSAEAGRESEYPVEVLPGQKPDHEVRRDDARTVLRHHPSANAVADSLTVHPPEGWALNPVNPAYERVVQKLTAYRRARGRSSVLVAGAVRHEGASTVARNIARALIETSKDQVLLVDANLRAPVQHEALGVKSEPGLAEVLASELHPSATIWRLTGTRMALLTCGGASDNPAHLMSHSALNGVVASLESDFDWVVVDGPALTVFPDSAGLAHSVGGAVLVCRAESTRSEVAEEARRVIEGAGADVIGAVLNRRRYHIPEIIYRRL